MRVPEKRIFLSPPYLFGDEQKLVDEAFCSNYIAPCGPMVERFEQALADKMKMPAACVLSSCTAALDLLFHELRVQAGDTVFCSNLTFIASIAPAVQRGATPVFIGSDTGSWTMSPGFLEQALEDAHKNGMLPKAVVAVDLYGQCCDYDAIEQICDKYGIPLIVDAAEALGAQYISRSGVKYSGDAGLAAVYSFNGNKIITSSGGGALLSRNKDIVGRAVKRSQQNREDCVWYEHAELGFNYRMSNIVAAIGLGQLMNLDEIINKKRRICEKYKEILEVPGEVDFMPEPDCSRSTRWLTVLTLRDNHSDSSDNPSSRVMNVVDALERNNIESRPVWKPMHLQPVFKGCRVYGQEVDENIFRNGVCLPSGTGLDEIDIERIANLTKKAIA